MARVKYDVTNAEARNFEVPKPGVYEAVIHDMEHGDSSGGNPMFTIVFEITKGDFKGSRIWHYILTEDSAHEWRLREFTDALGLKPKGTIDTTALKGTVVRIKTAVDPARDGYDEKAKIKNVLPIGEGTSAGGDDDEEDAPYDEWEVADLREEVEARELEVEGKKTKKKLIAALEADDEEGDEEDEDEDEDEGEDEEEDEDSEEDEDEDEDEDEISRADLEEMDRAELKKLIADEELEVKVTKKKTEDKLREEIAEALELDEDEDEDEEDEEESDEEDTDYSEWDVADLKKTLKERGLKTEGRKSVLVKRLEKDDESSDDEPF